MVHRMVPIEESPVREKWSRRRTTVKSEFDNDCGDDYVFFAKRQKLDTSNQVEGVGLTEYNPFGEASPLGLKLKKSPSLLDLIQMRLSQEKGPSLATTLARKEKSNAIDKLKASNFPASLLKIGTWEYASRYEGDLVAKCYFAKHKLVWEVLDGGLKNKIEIQWSDIMAIKAKYPDNKPESLDVVAAFSSVSTGHFTKHFEKLMQCDLRLRFLSQQPEKVLDSPYFQPMVSIYGESSDFDHGYSTKADGGV